MKKVLTNFLAIGSVALLMLASCNKSGVLATSNGGKAGTLSASTATLLLDKTKLTDTTSVINFSFTAPQYGFAAAVNNTLQIDVPGDNWANPTTFALAVKDYSQGFSTSVFNALVLKLNLPAGQASPVVVRIMHSLGQYVAPIYSNVVTLTVTPFDLTSWVYVPGAYEGWNNPGSQEDSLISVTGNGIYTGIIDFTAGNNQFLIVPAKNWSNKWATGSGPATGTSVSYPVTYNGSNNFYAPAAAGYYLVTLNTNTNTLTIVPADYYSVTGDAATGWGNDTFMKFINDGNNNWVVTLPLVSTGAFKIRQDAQWTNSWGTGGANGELTDASGGNISIPTSGNYTVTFTMAPSAYGSAPVTLAPYTVVKQ